MQFLFYTDLANYGLMYSRSHLWKLEKEGKFPKHVKLGAGRVGWLRTEIEEFVANRIAERDRRVENQAA